MAAPTCGICGRPEWPGRYDDAPPDWCSAGDAKIPEYEVECYRLGYERLEELLKRERAAYAMANKVAARLGTEPPTKEQVVEFIDRFIASGAAGGNRSIIEAAVEVIERGPLTPA